MDLFNLINTNTSKQSIEYLIQKTSTNLHYFVLVVFLFTIFIIWSINFRYTQSFLANIHKVKYSQIVSILIWINPIVFYQFLSIFNCDSLQSLAYLIKTQSYVYVDYYTVFQRILRFWNSCIFSAYCMSQIFNQYNNRFYCSKNNIFKCLLVFLDPINVNLLIVQKIHQSLITAKQKKQDIQIDQQSKRDHFFLIKIIILAMVIGILLLISPINYYKQLIFLTTFSPQKNLIWILYGHMFNHYLKYYQTTFFLMNILISFPIAYLKIGYHLKVLILFVANVYLSSVCGNVKMLMVLVLGTSLLRTYQHLFKFNTNQSQQKNCEKLTEKNSKQISQSIQTMLKVFKILCIVGYVGGIFFFLIYCRLLNLYLHSFMVNIGHVFLFGCIPWTLIFILLVQMIQIQQKINRSIPLIEEIKKSWKQIILNLFNNKQNKNIIDN